MNADFLALFYDLQMQTRFAEKM